MLLLLLKSTLKSTSLSTTGLEPTTTREGRHLINTPNIVGLQKALLVQNPTKKRGIILTLLIEPKPYYKSTFGLALLVQNPTRISKTKSAFVVGFWFNELISEGSITPSLTYATLASDGLATYFHKIALSLQQIKFIEH